MSPSRSRRNHPDIFARPLIPFREKPETSSSSTEPTPPPSYLQRRYGLNEEIFERRVLPKARKLGHKEEQREVRNDKNKGVVGAGSRLSVMESASGSAPDDTTRAFPVERRTMNATTTSTTSCTSTSSGVELTPLGAIFAPTASTQTPNYGGPEPATAVITAASTTSPNEHDIIQSRPEASYVNKSHVPRRSPSQCSQLVSDSEISVLDLGPSLNVGDAAVPVPVTAPGAGVIQMGAGSESEIALAEAITIPISTNTSSAATTTNPGGYGYGRDVRGVSFASAPEESSGELAHYGDGGDGDDAGCGYGSSTSGSPDTGEMKKQQPGQSDGSDDRECEFDCQNGYVYGYGYSFDYGHVGDGDEHGAKREDTTPAISSPVLAPLKTTRKEEAHGIGSRSRARAFCI